MKVKHSVLGLIIALLLLMGALAFSPATASPAVAADSGSITTAQAAADTAASELTQLTYRN